MTLVALVGLAFSERGILNALAPRKSMLTAVLAGLAVAAACVFILWLLRAIPPLKLLENWQRGVVAGWTTTDAVAVALVSGIAEEALLRAFLQPVIGLVPAALVFALLHVVPDRKLWFWPLFALASGLVLGVLFDSYGYPAAAVAHIVINLVALLRLRHPASG